MRRFSAGFGVALQHDSIIPHGRHHLAEAGYPLIKGLLFSFRGVRYHLNERGKCVADGMYIPLMEKIMIDETPGTC